MQVATEGDVTAMVTFMNLLTRKKALLKELQVLMISVTSFACAFAFA